ncbi:MAG: DUF4922 domain-containing protein, partial [Tannerella sp.]|nr:DUF4922 domain-containing protein [Tannerella sp.]
ILIAKDSEAGLVYADHYKIEDGKKTTSPVITYQKGSLRDDFDFGSVLVYKSSALKEAVSRMNTDYRFAGLYDLRLKVSQTSAIVHLNEYLYAEVENDTRKSGEKLFDYVNPRNRAIQIEMEQACTDHLKVTGAYLAPQFKTLAFDKADFEYEASVIIPVRNRIRTIAGAIHSVLRQKTNFKFNLIIIDNYSTDGTTEAIDEFTDERLIHIIPENKELGIGGCWNAGVAHPECGMFAVQLDSDDVYSGEDTLQKIVDAFYEQNCAMVVGTYRLTDFDLQTIPPGVIEHREWTPENGRNNALRINGLGAPRAFYTPLLRQIKAPNTSYGEDYALGLYFSREYRIGRVYDVLYLCRRWDDNSDASLDIEKLNAHNTYKDRIRTWEVNARIRLNKQPSPATVQKLFQQQVENWDLAHTHYDALKGVESKEFALDGFSVRMQFNPARIKSSAAKIDAESIRKRACFLCPANMPEEQQSIDFKGEYQLLVNPYPIFPQHFTIPAYDHTPQLIAGRYEDMLDLAEQSDLVVFYNGPTCGASAPDHFHFQAGNKGFLPIEKEISKACREIVYEKSGVKVYAVRPYLWNGFWVEATCKEAATRFFNSLYSLLDIPAGESEPMLNLITWYEDAKWRSGIIPRAAHRPACFSAEGDAQILSTPASVEMGGVFVTPLEKDFKKITAEDIRQILKEVCISDGKLQEIITKIKAL